MKVGYLRPRDPSVVQNAEEASAKMHVATAWPDPAQKELALEFPSKDSL